MLIFSTIDLGFGLILRFMPVNKHLLDQNLWSVCALKVSLGSNSGSCPKTVGLGDEECLFTMDVY